MMMMMISRQQKLLRDHPLQEKEAVKRQGIIKHRQFTKRQGLQLCTTMETKNLKWTKRRRNIRGKWLACAKLSCCKHCDTNTAIIQKKTICSEGQNLAQQRMLQDGYPKEKLKNLRMKRRLWCVYQPQRRNGKRRIG